MAVPMVTGPQTLISLVLNRSSRDFDEHDRQLLDLVRPGMAHLYRHAVAREEALQAVTRLREMTIEQGGAVLVLDRDRRLRGASGRAARTWRRYFPGERLEIGGRLRGQAAAWLDCLPGPDVLPAASFPVLEVTREGMTLAISAVVDHVREECYLLLRERTPALSLDRLAALSLTPREREVLVWVAAGKTNAEVAEIIGARPRTVHKHLERIFSKLGVETRTAAVARAFGLKAITQGALGEQCAASQAIAMGWRASAGGPG
ncbi:MAG: helix-turn-helix transcriptional regulator [Betaproteobacteria bacterium]|nr:helix-turn-helix transcriptional regulator [Betaproteobacteria bacterium]